MEKCHWPWFTSGENESGVQCLLIFQVTTPNRRIEYKSWGQWCFNEDDLMVKFPRVNYKFYHYFSDYLFCFCFYFLIFYFILCWCLFCPFFSFCFYFLFFIFFYLSCFQFHPSTFYFILFIYPILFLFFWLLFPLIF
jgi:hypothetical protein